MNQDFDMELINAFNIFLNKQNLLVSYLQGELNPNLIWLVHDNKIVSDRNKLISSLISLRPMNELPQATLSCAGVVGCNQQTLIFIDELNSIKTEFKAIVQRHLNYLNTNNTAIIREVLAAHGYPSIKIKHVYRHLKYVRYHPRRFALGQSTSSSHKIISVTKAEELLMKIGQGKHIDLQLDQLHQLSAQSKLVIARKVPNHWIANVSTFKNSQGISTHTKIKSSLPIFYLHDTTLPIPSVNLAKKREKQIYRTDRKIEEKVFLPSISAYQYMAL